MAGLSVTIDGSTAVANGIFLQSERHFDAAASYEDMKTRIAENHVELFSPRGVVPLLHERCTRVDS